MAASRKRRIKANGSSQRGFSLIELLAVVALMMIISGVAYFYLSSHQDMYKADEQALTISDVFQEARQRSLTQRETIRVEIDLTDNIVRLYDENSPATASDDTQIRTIPLLNSAYVRVDQRPGQISTNPPEEYPVPTAQFVQSNYPNSLAHDVCTVRFLSNGTVVDQGTNEVGAGAVSTGLTMHVWMPDKNNPSNSSIARSITVIGTTGSIRLWEYDPQLPGANKWKDSRRTSVFGS